MNRNLPLIPTGIFLACVIAAVVTAMYWAEKTTDVTNQQVVQSPNGQIFVLHGLDLANVESNDASLSFEQQGLRNHVGQAIPLSTGEWLINKGDQNFFGPRAIIRIFDPSDKTEAKESSLLKCDSSINNCTSWGEEELYFPRSFDGIELENGNFLLIKANRDKVFLVSHSGELIDTVTGHQFWHGLFALNEDQYLAQDTKEKTLKVLKIVGKKIQFPELSDKHLSYKNLLNHKNISAKPIFYNNKLWFITDGYLKFIDNDSNSITDTEIEFSKVSDIELINNSLYVSQYNSLDILEINPNTIDSKKIKSDSLKKTIDKYKSSTNKEKKLAWLYTGLWGIPALAALFLALFKSKPVPLGFRSEFFGIPKDSTDLPDILKTPEIVWINYNRGRQVLSKTFSKILIPLLSLVIIYAAYVLMNIEKLNLNQSAQLTEILYGIIIMSITFIVLLYFLIQGEEEKLGVHNGKLIFLNKSSQQIEIASNQIQYASNAFFAKAIYFPLKQGRYYTYNTEELFLYVLPIIRNGEQISEAQLFKQRLKEREPKLMQVLAIVAMLVITVTIIEFI